MGSNDAGDRWASIWQQLVEFIVDIGKTKKAISAVLATLCHAKSEIFDLKNGIVIHYLSFVTYQSPPLEPVVLP